MTAAFRLWWRHRDRLWPVSLVALMVVGTFMFALLAAVVGGMSLTGQPQQASAEYDASGLAVSDIPPMYLQIYRQTGRKYGIDWAILAAIGKIETDHGRSTMPGVRSGVNAYGCCAGPMQFDKSGTWPAYATDGDGNGTKDIYDPHDAIPAAAKYLKASGAPGDYHAAIFAYNHAEWYVADVMRQAAEYRGALRQAQLLGGSNLGTIQAAGAQAVLRNPRIQLTGVQRSDLQSGLIDVRVTTALAWMAQRHTIYISAMRSDHAPGTNHNPPGRAVDIAMVDGRACTGSRSEPCGRLSAELCRVPGRFHSTEFIRNYDPCPGFQDWNEDGGDDSWPRGDHANHIHWGYDSKPVQPKYLKGG